MGTATFELGKLNEDATQEGIESKILKDGKERGELRFDVSFYPVLKPQKVDGKEEELPDTSESVFSKFYAQKYLPYFQRSALSV